MTIPEAATLVLQSSVLLKGDVFLLDMGEPVGIKALAEQMVRLSGLSLRDAANPDGDIEIVCTGLRPGEKLYEELLIEAESQPTAHPLIYRAKERSSPDELWSQLFALDLAIKAQDVKTALELLAALVPEWRRANIDFHRESAIGTCCRLALIYGHYCYELNQDTARYIMLNSFVES